MAKELLGRVRDFGDRTVKVKWVIPAYLMIGLIAFALSVTSIRYSHDQREEARRDAAVALHAADVSSWENARDERARCESGVNTVNTFRSALLDVYAFIDEQGNPEFAAAATARLNERLPERALGECPPDPGERPNLDAYIARALGGG